MAITATVITERGLSTPIHAVENRPAVKELQVTSRGSAPTDLDVGFKINNGPDRRSDIQFNLPNLIGDCRITWRQGDCQEIRTFNRRRLVGRMPDASLEMIENALTACREQASAWQNLGLSRRLDVLRKAGEALEANDSYDAVIARTGWFTRKVVAQDRMMTARWLQASENYLRWAFGDQRVDDDNIHGLGAVGIIIQSSMFQTGAYGIIDALRAGNSVLVKLDSRDPYPEFVVAETLSKAGAPVQILSFDTGSKPQAGRMIIDHMDKVVFMGNPASLTSIVYGETLRDMEEQGFSPETLANIRTKLLPPAKVISYTAHLGGAYVHDDADISATVDHLAQSFTSHYRACKRLATVTIHPHIYEDLVDKLRKKVLNLSLGDPSDHEAEVIRCSRNYWRKFVGPHLESARRMGIILAGAENDMAPKLIEIELDKLSEDGAGFLGHEVMFPMLNVIKGDRDVAAEVTRLMAKITTDGRILEFAVFSKDRDAFYSIQNKIRAYNFHHNQPTTWGLGDTQSQGFRYHQRRCLAVDLAGHR